MKKSTIAIIIIFVVVIIGIWVYSSGSKNTQSSSNNPPTTLPTANQNNQNNNSPIGQLFSSSPLAQNSYLISTPTYDANTKKALSGFNVVKKSLADGSTQYTLNAQNPEYKTQTYVVKPGEKLYFIEANLVDDNGSTDKFLGDDQAVLVDANGYIVAQ